MMFFKKSSSSFFPSMLEFVLITKFGLQPMKVPFRSMSQVYCVPFGAINKYFCVSSGRAPFIGWTQFRITVNTTINVVTVTRNIIAPIVTLSALFKLVAPCSVSNLDNPLVVQSMISRHRHNWSYKGICKNSHPESNLSPQQTEICCTSYN